MEQENDNPIITEPFYLKKFMQIQRVNVTMHDILTMLREDEQIRKRAEELYGPNIFLILDKTPV